MPLELRTLLAFILLNPDAAISYAQALRLREFRDHDLVKAVAAFNPLHAESMLLYLRAEIVEALEVP